MATLPPAEIGEALGLLGVRRLVLSIHDPSFPPGPGEDLGRGTPYGAGGRAFLEFVRSLGFDAVQLGPQGQTSRGNPSPYDGTIFARNTASIGLAALADDPRRRGLLRAETVDRLARTTPEGGPAERYVHAYDAARAALAECYASFRSGLAAADPHARELARDLDTFRARHASWLVPYALHEVLEARHGGGDHAAWPAADALLYANPGDDAQLARRALLAKQAEPELEAFALGQLLAHEQHEALRAALRPIGLALYGDLQIGLSTVDVWAHRGLLLEGYRMGAPPSRTNPEGQPWGYPILDPAGLEAPDGSPGPALRFHLARVAKALAEYDGLRLDHPHGIVCPWVYRADDPDPFHAVRSGARLRASPDFPDHPALAPLAIARPEQLDRSLPRHADHWVRALDEGQVARYARVLDAIAEALGPAAPRASYEPGDHAYSDRLVCEVLSTLPYPLARAMERHRLGRFRVTQKANLGDLADVYRAENARPEDWIMVGNHDTAPIWRLADAWHGTDEGDAQAAHLARVLSAGGDAEPLRRALASDPRALVHAKVAELFVSPAAHVLVFFADLFGMKDVYNRPGVVSSENWSLRVPSDFARRYERALESGEAIDLPCALALALRARGLGEGDLLGRLDRLARFRIDPRG